MPRLLSFYPSYSVTKNKRNQSQREYFVSFIQNIRKSSNISKYLAFGICLCLKTASFSILNKNWFVRVLKANIYFLAWSIVDELFIDYPYKKENCKLKPKNFRLKIDIIFSVVGLARVFPFHTTNLRSPSRWRYSKYMHIKV